MLFAEIVVAGGSILLIGWALVFVKLTGQSEPRYSGRHRNA